MKLNSYPLPLKEFERYNKIFWQWIKLPKQQRKELLVNTEYKGQELKEFENFIDSHTDFAGDSVTRKLSPEKYFQYHAFFSHGILTISGLDAPDKDAQNIIKRFA